MTIKKILLKRGGASESAGHAGEAREVAADLGRKSLRIHDGETPGGALQALEADVPKTLSSLRDSGTLLRKAEFTKLSLLADDVGYWQKSALTKVSQLQNDVGYKAGHCTYCTHCSYCSNCGRCNQVRCNQVRCTEIKCNQVQCTQCTQCNCQCNCDCGDDS